MGFVLDVSYRFKPCADRVDVQVPFDEICTTPSYLCQAVCLQEAGETIFVPSGWHHTVMNLEDTLSINHNWLNAYNVHWAWALLQQEYKDAAAAIEDCR